MTVVFSGSKGFSRANLTPQPVGLLLVSMQVVNDLGMLAAFEGNTVSPLPSRLTGISQRGETEHRRDIATAAA